MNSAIAVIVGASLGASLRWGLGVWLNSVLPQLALGTLVANLIGAYLAGLALGLFAHHSGLSDTLRLLIITGFLGSLTTFSAFSAEVVELLRAQRLLWAIATISLHLLGSLALTVLGLLSYSLARNIMA